MSDTVLKKIDIQPGYNKNTTDYGAENYYVDGDGVRFRNGKPEKHGGWVKETVNQFSNSSNLLFTGVARAIHDWVDLSFSKYFAVGTHKKVEAFNGGLIYDITPYREELTLNNAVTTNGTTSVKITDVNHGLVVGDYVYVDSQQTAVDGVDLQGEYTVTTVIDADNYTVTYGSAASGSTSLAGGTLEINYLLQVGDQDNGNVTGYGGGTWDTEGAAGGGYDMPRSGTGGQFLRMWSLDNWGEDLIATMRNGKIYQWDATNGLGVRLQEITQAPDENLLSLVAQPSRHLVAFGTNQVSGGVFDPLNIRWASQETLTDWTPSDTNTAGEYRLPLGNYITTAIQTKSEILVFTDSTLYSMRNVSSNDVFEFNVIGDNISAVSQHCGVDVNGIVFWMGVDSFYIYDGVARHLDSPIDEFIFDQDGEGRLNYEQKEKVYCSTNTEFNEIIWFYPSHNSTEIDRYVIYNYAENIWYDGSVIQRTVWLDKSIFSKPYAIDSTGKLFIHEQGKDNDGSPITAYLKSGYLDIEDGQDLVFVDKFIPDFKLIPNRNASLTLYLKKYPNSEESTKGPYQFNNDTEKVSLRARARQIAIKYEVNAVGADFEVGAPRFSFQPDGGR
jgi:hypothetical protein